MIVKFCCSKFLTKKRSKRQSISDMLNSKSNVMQLMLKKRKMKRFLMALLELNLEMPGLRKIVKVLKWV